jgi:hypothetical protein
MRRAFHTGASRNSPSSNASPSASNTRSSSTSCSRRLALSDLMQRAAQEAREPYTRPSKGTPEARSSLYRRKASVCSLAAAHTVGQSGEAVWGRWGFDVVPAVGESVHCCLPW